MFFFFCQYSTVEDRKFTNRSTRNISLKNNENINKNGLDKWFWAEYIEIILL